MSESMTGIQMVLDNIRPSFEYNVSYVSKFLEGRGLDMGCGNCPLLKDNCLHIDVSPQPLAELQVPKEDVIQQDAVNFISSEPVDYVFSSHMVEDLPDELSMITCLLKWSRLLKGRGYIVLLIPDMEGCRYPKVDDPSGNPSHRVNVGKSFFEKISKSQQLENILKIVQIDTIPHEKSCTMDVVFRRRF